jgi:hypothetical protein
MGTASSGRAADGKNFPRQREGKLPRVRGARRLGRPTPALQLFRILTTASSNTNFLKARRCRRCQAHSVRPPGHDRQNWRHRFDAAVRLGKSFPLCARRADEDETNITVEIRDGCPAEGPRSIRMAELVASHPRRQFRMWWITKTRILKRIYRLGERSGRPVLPEPSESSMRSTKKPTLKLRIPKARTTPIALARCEQVNRWARANGL